MGIKIVDIHKSFEDNHVLRGIDFEFDPGKINMIIGASGSGKSVLMKCIVGLLEPDQGEVYFGDASFLHCDYAEKKEIRKNIGMLFQGGALFDSMTVEENVGFPMQTFTHESVEKVRERVNFCLERVNLTGVNKLYPAEISGGMQKRVGIARAIVMNPKYLFVDEPNSGLDPLTASKIDELILELTREYEMTTVVVTHDMNSVMNVGDKVMFLHKGKKEWEGSNKEILHTTNPALEEFVFVSDLIRRD